jgi:hypothetical protein
MHAHAYRSSHVLSFSCGICVLGKLLDLSARDTAAMPLVVFSKEDQAKKAVTYTWKRQDRREGRKPWSTWLHAARSTEDGHTVDPVYPWW